MAGNAHIGALRVSLGMDSAQFESGAKRAQGVLAGLSSTIKGFAAGISGALTFGAVTSALGSAINRMDDMGKAAQKIGIPVEQLSGLSYAAKLADVDLESLQGNLGRFNKAVAEIAGGGTNSASSALRAIGVSALDANGKLRPTPQILADIADRFAGYKDGAEKAAIAQALFGKAGADMIPLLNGGAAGLQEGANKARQFGAVVSQEAAVAAEQFNDNLTDVIAVGQALLQQVIAPMLPALNDLMEQFLRSGQGGVSFAKMIADDVTRSLVDASAAIAQTRHELNAVGEIWGAIKAIPQTKTIADIVALFSQANANIKKHTMETSVSIRNLYNSIDDPTGSLGSIDAFLKKSKAAAQLNKPPAPTVLEFTPPKKNPAVETFKPVKKLVDDTRDSFKNLGIAAKDTAAVVGTHWMDAERVLSDTKQETQAVAQEFSQVLGGAAQNAIQGLINGTFKWKQALADVAGSLANIFLKPGLAGLGAGAGGGSGGFLSGLLGSVFGGFRAAGGPMLSGRAYMVGENGPEMVVPRGNGMVIPNHMLGGGGSVTFAPNVTIQGNADPSLMKRVLDAQREQLKRELPGMMTDARTRGRLS